MLKERSILNDELYSHALEGLTARKKALSPKYLYDARGSHYFDLICKLPEYYPYRHEFSLLPEIGRSIDKWLKEDVCVVEFGAGSLHKIRPLLKSSSYIKSFVPVDISAEHLQSAGDKLQKEFPNVHIQPFAGDFTQPLKLPANYLPLMGFFPGSTIGNFSPDEARQFLQNAQTTLKGSGAMMLLGIDTQTDEDALHKAYNDESNVTASFNKNILVRMNREIGANFQTKKFTHKAHFNHSEGRIEMHLYSDEEQEVVIGDTTIHFAKGESIHTENSYKYSPARIDELLQDTGWKEVTKWQSENAAFTELLIQY